MLCFCNAAADASPEMLAPIINVFVCLGSITLYRRRVNIKHGSSPKT